jgi:hypothetical protein
LYGHRGGKCLVTAIKSFHAGIGTSHHCPSAEIELRVSRDDSKTRNRQRENHEMSFHGFRKVVAGIFQSPVQMKETQPTLLRNGPFSLESATDSIFE